MGYECVERLRTTALAYPTGTGVEPVITINWMANSIVFIDMVTHQCAFTPRMHLQGKTVQRRELSAIALFANLQCAFCPNFCFSGG